MLRMTDHDADFEYGLRVLIEGFRAEIAREAGNTGQAASRADPLP
ncbi:hypothetical protein ABT093_02665 [Kitasatospora sp. NPDC002551]